MRVETIELLRCPAAHESSPLVTVAHARNGDRLIEGTLGCPICGAEYPLKEGVALLADHTGSESPTDSVDAMRTAALLGLSEPGMRVALCGAFGSVADEIEQATGATCITVNASPIIRSASTADHVVLASQALLPFSSASLAGLAVDDANLALLADAARVVRAGGRVLAPARASTPAGVTELARDEQAWVAVVEAAGSRPVGLTRGGSRSA